MADISPFRAYRYDLARVGMLRDVVAPPYDVIDSAMQQTLYERSPHNVIRLILNKEEPGDSDANNRYTRAAGFLRDWLSTKILAQDSARSLYVYHQEFAADGKRYTRKGFLTRVRLEPFGRGRIFAHEETMSGPKADRLRLFHATNTNLSPVFGLYPDEDHHVQDMLDAAVRRSLPLEATDDLGVVSRLWPVTDQKVLSEVTGLMGPQPIFIADGHHRYETALRYLDDKKQAGEVKDNEAAANFVLMMLVSMSDPGLLILPTHRLVSGIGDLRSERLREILQPHFDCEFAGTGEPGAGDAWDLVQADGSQNVLGFGTVADGHWLIARFRNPMIMNELAAQHSEAWRGLGVSVLHVFVLERLLSAAMSAKPQCRYVHRLDEVTAATANKTCQLATLVPPATMRHVELIAGNLEKMPPKSTYFYPKLLSGLVFNSLKAN
jgi:uncharacterized protein (DUF1015 family)